MEILALVSPACQETLDAHPLVKPFETSAKDDESSLQDSNAETTAIYPITPDDRYFLVNKRLSRCSNPSLPDEERQQLVKKLMRAMRNPIRTRTPLKSARDAVTTAKVALGE